MKLPASTLAVALSASIAGLICTSCDSGETVAESGINKDHDRLLRNNMRVVQTAAEHYAADREGVQYPMTVDTDFKTYFPGGNPGNRAAVVGPVNPFSGENEFPAVGTEADIKAARSGAPLRIEPGVIKYAPLENGASYAIIGGAHDGKPLMDQHNPDQVLIFSNR